MNLGLDARDALRHEPMPIAQLDAGVDRWMDHDAAGERLVRILGELPGVAEAIGDCRVVALGREHVRESALAFDADRTAREIVLRKERSVEAVLCSHAGMERLAHRAEHLAQPRRLRRGDAERPDRLRFRESEHPCGRGRCAEDAGRAGDVPADVVVAGINGVADAALHLDAERERMNERAAMHRTVFREREERGGHGPRGMNHRAQVRIVEVERVRGHAVEQRGMQDVDALAASENACLRWPEEGFERGERVFDSRMAGRADRAAHPVQDRALRFVRDLHRKIGWLRLEHEVRKREGG